MISQQELSRRTRIHPVTLRRWAALGLLRPSFSDGRRTLYQDEAVDEAMRIKAGGPVPTRPAEPIAPTADGELPKYITITQAATLLGCSLATIHRMKADGRLAVYEGQPKIVRLDRDEVLEMAKLRRRVR